MKTIQNKTSTKNFFGVAILFFLITFSSIAEEILTNQNIISLTTAKVSKDIIIQKVKSNPNQFDMSSTALISLKTSRVSDMVVEEMLLAANNLPLVTNKDVIDMHQGCVSRDIIIKKIQFSKCDFNTNTDAMIELKNAKVPETVQKAMLTPGSSASVKSQNLISGDLPPHPVDLPAPALSKFSENGIYYEEYNPASNYTQLEPTTTNQAKGGGFGETILNNRTGGITGKSEKVGLSNTSANMIIKDPRPVFYFIFSGDRKNMNTVAESMFEGVASPNDFVLVKARVTNKGREITVGRHTRFKSESGFTEGTIQFRFKKISNEMYKVYFDADVPAGEYGFYYNKGSEQNSSLKIYDFSLQNSLKGK